LAAKTILAEIGTDMGRFPTAGHLLAWAGMCPGQNESAGKRKSSRLRKGSPWLKTLLVQCGWAASRKKDSYYKAQFNRLRGRHGAKKAVCAVAASMLTAVYHMLKDGTEHQDLGANHFDRRATEIKAKRLAAQIADDCGDARIAQFRRLERWKDRKAETRLNDSGGVGNSASAGHVLSRISAGAAGRAYFGADGT
jgi:hypothetical protein